MINIKLISLKLMDMLISMYVYECMYFLVSYLLEVRMIYRLEYPSNTHHFALHELLPPSISETFSKIPLIYLRAKVTAPLSLAHRFTGTIRGMYLHTLTYLVSFQIMQCATARQDREKLSHRYRKHINILCKAIHIIVCTYVQ